MMMMMMMMMMKSCYEKLIHTHAYSLKFFIDTKIEREWSEFFCLFRLSSLRAFFGKIPGDIAILEASNARIGYVRLHVRPGSVVYQPGCPSSVSEMRNELGSVRGEGTY